MKWKYFRRIRIQGSNKYVGLQNNRSNWKRHARKLESSRAYTPRRKTTEQIA
jgi:hypothetical protein